jgi:hypothetical protein
VRGAGSTACERETDPVITLRLLATVLSPPLRLDLLRSNLRCLNMVGAEGLEPPAFAL